MPDDVGLMRALLKTDSLVTLSPVRNLLVVDTSAKALRRAFLGQNDEASSFATQFDQPFLQLAGGIYLLIQVRAEVLDALQTRGVLFHVGSYGLSVEAPISVRRR